MRLKSSIAIMAIVLLILDLQANSLKLNSPDGNIQLEIEKDRGLTLDVIYKGQPVLESIQISLQIGEMILPGETAKMTGKKTNKVDQAIEAVVPVKDKKIKDVYNELVLEFSDGISVAFRAYNEGFAYRYLTSLDGEIEVMDEQLDLQFPEGTESWFPEESSMYSHFEPFYPYLGIDSLSDHRFCALPVLFRSKGVNILFTEAALHEYPCLLLEKNGKSTMKAIFPKFVLETIPDEKHSPDRNEIITKKAAYIAKTEGERDFPWRVFVVSDDDRTLVENNLVYQLSRPLVLEDTDWIKPGKVAWDWYNANNIFGVDFKAGLNEETYKYFVDFASENGIEYVILDEGWTKSTTEILESNPEINIKRLIEYAESKNVGIILWVLWKPLNDNLTEVLDTYSSLGARGIKVDFMQRPDQTMVESYTAIAREAAKRKLLVDFHGAFKPAGLRREYPNVLSYEGVKGNENNKWSKDVTPEHTLILPFIRMVAGPMDFTPGSMRNKQAINHSISFERPETLGTRCHQVAMYVIYESPLQMICENPSILKKEQETVDFIAQIPTVWDETIVLEAAVSDYLLIARRKGQDWYIGAMTDWTPRKMEVDFSFLPTGEYTCEIMKDGINAGRYAEDYKKETLVITPDSRQEITMAPGGGWAAILRKK
ncbi:MAG: glycoside hydrolase family 97 protein [Bacteroidales bacterium]|nr:glycoside hydrolase family 97 protein [Bacteroidales bacterium]